MTDNIDRRNFVKGTLASAAGAIGTVGALGSTTTTAKASAQVKGANDRIRIGVIGPGRQGMTNMNNAMKQPNTEIVAVCDVWEPNLNKAAAAAPSAEKIKDFRKLLDRKDIDGVLIGTPDHWHALQTVMACQAGKDVYVEKPTSITIKEGRKMVEATTKYNRIVQVGTQQRSGPHFQEVAKLISSGRIGKISSVRTWNFGNSAPAGIGNPPDSAPPADLDWDMWLGPAPKVPYNKNRFGIDPNAFSHFRWFWDYAGGMMTDWGVHWLDIVQFAMGDIAPQSVSATGGKFVLTDNRETPDTINAQYQFPNYVVTYENRVANGFPIGVSGTNRGSGILFYGSDGTMFVDRGGYEIFPEKRREGDKQIDRTEAAAVKSTGNHHLLHMQNFIECMRSRQKPICDMETGHRSTSMALLGNIAFRSRRMVNWDGRSEQIANDREASRYLSKEYRKPWSLNV